MNELARSIIDANTYMTLATADAAGLPWVSPVYFAHENYREFLWVSSPTRRHSQNVEARADVSLVVFDSQAAIGTGQAVFVAGTAVRVDDVEHDIEVFSRRSRSHGARAWSPSDVTADAPLRLYRATAAEQWVVDGAARGDHRTRVRL